MNPPALRATTSHENSGSWYTTTCYYFRGNLVLTWSWNAEPPDREPSRFAALRSPPNCRIICHGLSPPTCCGRGPSAVPMQPRFMVPMRAQDGVEALYGPSRFLDEGT